MTLGQLARVLAKVAGGGHPAVLRTPDGKEWVPVRVQNDWVVGDAEDNIRTVVHLEEAKP